MKNFVTFQIAYMGRLCYVMSFVTNNAFVNLENIFHKLGRVVENSLKYTVPMVI